MTTLCTSCRYPYAYAPFRSLECINSRCAFFSVRQLQDVSAEHRPVLMFSKRDLRVTFFEDIHSVRVTVYAGSMNIMVRVEGEEDWAKTCESFDVVKTKTGGDQFFLAIHMWNSDSPNTHRVLLECLDAKEKCVYSLTTEFSPTDPEGPFTGFTLSSV